MRVERRHELIALIAGALVPLAFAPLNIFPVAVVAVAVLYALWLHASAKRSAWLGFLFGFAMFGVGVSWVFVSMHNFGNMVSPLAAFATILFAAAMASYIAAAGFLQARFRNIGTTLRLAVVMPFLWVIGEWLRSWLFTGFPWLNLGYSQIATPLKGLAPWFGVYAMSLVSAVTAGLLLLWFRQGPRQGWRFAAIIVGLWLVGLVAGSVNWVAPAGGPVRIALVQGNVPIGIKWDPHYRDAILQLYLKLSRGVRDADLVVWPEGALPIYLNSLDEPFEQALEQEARKNKTAFLFGAVDSEEHDGETHYYNAVAGIGQTRGVYHKRHLVPFGEYPPLRPLFFWLLDAMDIPMSDFSAAREAQQPLSLAGQQIGVSICYETAFGEEIIDMLPTATLLVNVSENAWFGDSLGPHQLLQMTRLRAIETGRPILRADNAGLSAVIDREGQVQALAPQFRQSVIEATVQPMLGATPYVRLGNWPVVLLLLAGLATAEWRRRRPATGSSGKTP